LLSCHRNNSCKKANLEWFARVDIKLSISVVKILVDFHLIGG